MNTDRIYVVGERYMARSGKVGRLIEISGKGGVLELPVHTECLIIADIRTLTPVDDITKES